MPDFVSLSLKKAKEGFFDREKVKRLLDKPTRYVFNEFGRQVRKMAQKSLVYSDDVSSRGSPPHAHKSRTITRKSKSTGRTRTRSVSFLREFLFYSLDTSSKSVVIGPVRLSSTIDPGSPHALEYGGSATVMDHKKLKKVTIDARPFMQPAFKKELPNLPAMWANSIR